MQRHYPRLVRIADFFYYAVVKFPSPSPVALSHPGKTCNPVFATMATLHVKAFLQRNTRFYVSTDRFRAGCALTHTFLDGWNGGRLCLPPAYQDEFFDCVARDLDLDQSHPLCTPRIPPICELRSPIFCFYIDFDIVVAPELHVDADALGRIVTKQAARFMPALKIYSILLSAPLKATRDGNVKQGFHMHFPHMFVTTHEALVMREGIIVALEAAPEMAHVDWPVAFDNSPYVNETGGIRMPGAPKAGPCPLCKNKKPAKAMCYKTEQGGCDCTGTLIENRCYGLHACFDGDGNIARHELDVFTGNTAQLVRACSIRTERSSIAPQWSCFDGCPSYSRLKIGKDKMPSAGKRVRTFDEEGVSLRKWPKQNMLDDIKRQRIQHIFQTRFGAIYAQVSIGGVKMGKDKFFCEFKGEGESWCQNVGRSHNSNRVYGVVEKTKAYIRCHCSCATTQGRLSGRMCKDFMSESRFLTPKDIDALWDRPDTLELGTKKMGGILETPERYLERLAREVGSV